jgi:hypothetical protein
MGLEIGLRADFWCNMHFFSNRGRSQGSWGPKAPKTDQKPGFKILSSLRSAQGWITTGLRSNAATSPSGPGERQVPVMCQSAGVQNLDGIRLADPVITRAVLSVVAVSNG